MYLTDFCCLCLGCNVKVSSQININSNAREVIKYVIPESVLQNSEVPIQVCENCLYSINYIHKFKQSCLRNVLMFSEHVQKLIREHGPFKYLSVTVDELSKGALIENHQNVGISEEPSCEATKSDFLSDTEPDDGPSTENQDESHIEEVMVKVEIPDDMFMNEETEIGENPLTENPFTENPLTENLDESIEVTVKVENPENVINEGPKYKQNVCDICNKLFSSSVTLKRHKQLHTDNQQQYPCGLCEKNFSQISYLRKHMRIHSADKRYVCETCQKAFIDLASLKEHRRTHTGERPFECDICGKTFAQRCNFMSHKRLHSGLKPYVCPICHKAFSKVSYLRVHGRVHSDRYEFQFK